MLVFLYMKTTRILNIAAQSELEKLAAHIQIARKRRKLTLSAIAERTGVAISTISRLESGDPRVALGTMLQVLSILGLLRGLSELVAPENDVQQALHEARNIRLGKSSTPKGVFSATDLDF